MRTIYRSRAAPIDTTIMRLFFVASFLVVTDVEASVLVVSSDVVADLVVVDKVAVVVEVDVAVVVLTGAVFMVVIVSAFPH